MRNSEERSLGSPSAYRAQVDQWGASRPAHANSWFQEDQKDGEDFTARGRKKGLKGNSVDFKDC